MSKRHNKTILTEGTVLTTVSVPEAVRSQVLQWAHSSQFACHPGIHRTLQLVKQRFWRPSMTADTRAFVLACTVCAHGRSYHWPTLPLTSPQLTLEPYWRGLHYWPSTISTPHSPLQTDFLKLSRRNWTGEPKCRTERRRQNLMQTEEF